MKINLFILVSGLLLLPMFYLLFNKMADVWEASVGKIMNRSFWPRKYILPFLVFSGILHITIWLVIPVIKSF